MTDPFVESAEVSAASPEPEHHEPHPHHEPLPSPGAMLRHARERTGMSVEDLAGQIKLAKNTMEALEHDDFAMLSEPVYVRGYYRKCAKVLPVNEKELLAAYDARVKPQERPQLPQRIPLAGGVSPAPSRRSRKRGVILVVVGLLLVLLIWTTRQEEPSAVKRSTVELSSGAGTDQNGASTATETGPTEMSEPPADQAPAPAAPAAPVAAPGIGPSPTASSANAPIKQAAQPAAGSTQLALMFDEPSWVRVEDSRNKTLLIGLVRAGERQVLEGQPPYSVFLGNAQKAKVEYGGQPVDLSRYINKQNDTARFTVP